MGDERLLSEGGPRDVVHLVDTHRRSCDSSALQLGAQSSGKVTGHDWGRPTNYTNIDAVLNCDDLPSAKIQLIESRVEDIGVDTRPGKGDRVLGPPTDGIHQCKGKPVRACRARQADRVGKFVADEQLGPAEQDRDKQPVAALAGGNWAAGGIDVFDQNQVFV